MKKDSEHARMNRIHVRHPATGIVLLLAVFVWAGCAALEGVQTVKVHRHLFKPDLPASFASVYGGKRVDLNDFINRDQKTRVWTYYSPDRKFAYEASVPLEYYAMDCFREAFWKAGMAVMKFTPDKNIPDMSLVIDRWSDQEFKFTVTVMKGGFETYKNQFDILMPSLDEKAGPVDRENNAYAMMNKAVVAVMSDPVFQAMFK